MNDHNTEPRQRFLALDTSTAQLAVSVLEEMTLLTEMNTSAERNHSVHLHPVMAEALQQAGMTMDEVSGIAVGVGPGSYTGIRIAVTAAKTLAWTLNLPVVGVSSLHALAWGGLVAAVKNGQPPEGGSWIVPLLDARRGQVYTALFGTEGSEMSAPVRLENDGIRLMQTWLQEIKERIAGLPEQRRPQHVFFVGEVDIHAEAARELEGFAGTGVSISPYSLEGRWVGYLGAKRLLAQEADEPHSLVPNYTQLSEAEANLLRKR
ncbi:tRNA (adenosine(37)-N6)-threonylcarbamoyltransferase complex dimerization subunit type 1 TsaB [Paenibacillus campinasensis]|uniref:tRNA (Adenosine(37)-N6)-threonylcarbamoyltransferase complex dimerization subunit type 1 TsaB n=1 Tax=Paenibacillus campinasensis TaxID=66347 RepID=A0A268EX57_9BACL|nr:tRNA (adenosine(37)-N6)-threonylcarbamoyltransferase complex dimerization subunit type 1 TsaB [Paenibacillus campinasensis]PAD77703.1 tRNA (adenosine(37)-N6)-threonylcarbamoyltransferase complex dimerization subunit type 1 TsaB [Paenibacillus campinasensis]